MPLSKSMTKNEAMGELMSSYKRKGTIGKSGPIGMKKARKISYAIVMDKLRKNQLSKG